jgi:arylsulfatase A-like enzyme
VKSWTLLAAAGLGLVAVTALAAVSMPWTRPPATHPNVLFVVWDTVRADHLSLYGHDKPTTPFLESIANESVVFDRAVSPSFWTLPSHASLFTGLAASVHGADADYKWLDNRFLTVAEHFGANGYDTYAWSSNPNISRTANTVQGFDTFQQPFGRNLWRDQVEAHTKSLLDPEDHTTRDNPERYTSIAFHKTGPVTRDAFFGWLDETRDRQRPFFAFLNYMEAHAYRLPSEASRRIVAPDPAAYASMMGTSNLLRRQTNVMFGRWKDYTRRERQGLYDLYDSSILDLDGYLREVFGGLKDRGLLEDTIVVVTADHGEQFGEHGLYLHNFSVYDPLVHVPLLVHWPAGGLAPRRVPDTGSTGALFSTHVDLAKLPQPDAPILEGNLTEHWRGPVVSELTAPCANPENRRLDFGIRDWSATYTAIYDGEVKLIEASNGQHELYNLERDDKETTNLFGIPRSRETAERLLAALDTWRNARPVLEITEEERAAEAAAREANRDEELMGQLEELGYVDEHEGEPAPEPAPGTTDAPVAP